MRSALCVHRCRLGLFLLLNVVDLVLTWRLVHADGSPFYEGNPLARWVLQAGGWSSLAAFKLGVALVVAAATIAVAHIRPRLGQHLLTLGCLAVGGVVLYSFALPRVYGVLPEDESPEVAIQAQRRAALESLNVQIQTHHRVKDRLVEAVAGHRCNLREATELLLNAEQNLPAYRLRYLHWLYPDCSDRECVAAGFIGYAVVHYQRHPASARRLWRELEQEYRMAFGGSVPRCRVAAGGMFEFLEEIARDPRTS